MPVGRSNNSDSGHRGIILLVTLVLLVVLSTLAYTLSARISAQRHRDQYLIDYAKARYGCDSAVKYALASLEELKPTLVPRQEVPDFSDVFALDDAQYEELLVQLAEHVAAAEAEEKSFIDSFKDPNSLSRPDQPSDSNDANGIDIDEEQLFIPGPYGPEWPLVTEPMEFDLGSARVTIEIEDENAKYPLGWALLSDPEVEREVKAGFVTFCEWMRISGDEIDRLEAQLEEIAKLKKFKTEFKPITRTIRSPTSVSTRTSAATTGTTRTRRTPLTRITRKTITAAAQAAEQAVFFSRLFHSSMIDTETLARPTATGRDRDESALKYLGIWGSTKVNINTAPRHVLEAAFMFGGDAERIASEVIRIRREKPIEDLDELKQVLLGYSDAIRKCEKYITLESRFFTIRVTAVSGGAKASSIIAITKDGKRIQRVAVMNI